MESSLFAQTGVESAFMGSLPSALIQRNFVQLLECRGRATVVLYNTLEANNALLTNSQFPQISPHEMGP